MRALIMMTIVINKLMFSKWWNTSTWAKNKMQNAKWQPVKNGKCQPERAHRMSRSYTAGLRRMMGRRPSSVRVPFNYCCYKARKIHGYLLQFFLLLTMNKPQFFWPYIFLILFSLFDDKLNILSTSEIPFNVGTQLSLDTTVGLHLCVRTYSSTRTSERV